MKSKSYNGRGFEYNKKKYPIGMYNFVNNWTKNVRNLEVITNCNRPTVVFPNCNVYLKDFIKENKLII